MRQTELVLSVVDRKVVQDIISKGQHSSRELKRALILSGLDSGVKEDELVSVLKIGRTTIWRTRKAYIEEGLNKALYDDKRSGKPRRYGDDAIARVTALAHSAPPKGRARWTVRLLAQEADKQFNVGSISRETVRRALKKTP
ncbi:MAG: helix-turn-helix domain-containing protein [Deltaproteobacteria bacterium]|nr:helix-turn-helix domain-containing protein [Deltaproteobacteria bacterium]